MKKTIINLDEENIYSKKDEPVLIISKEQMDKCYSSIDEMIHEILTNQTVYDFVIERLEIGNSSLLTINSLVDGKLGLARSFSFVDIILTMNKLTDLGSLEKEKIALLNHLVSIEYLANRFPNQAVTTIIDGKNVTIDINYLISILLDKHVYNKLLTGNLVCNGYSNEEILYTLNKFICIYGVVLKTILPDDVKERMDNIVGQQICDYEALNKITKCNCPIITQYHNSKELTNALVSSMPTNLSVLEKSIYVYIMLCSILSRREDSFFECAKASLDEIQSNCLTASGMVTPSNNAVGNMEFSIIFAKCLHELGINFISSRIVTKNKEGATNYCYIAYRVGEFIIKTEPMDTLFENDLNCVKAGVSPKGLVCTNACPNTQEKYTQTVDRVLSVVLAQREISNSDSADLINNYSHALHRTEIEPTIDKKIDEMLIKLSVSGATKTEAIDFIKAYGMENFKTEIEEEKICFSVINNHLSANPSGNVYSIMITIMNKETGKNVYIGYFPPSAFIKYSKKELQQLLYDGIIEMVDNKIPGISASCLSNK